MQEYKDWIGYKWSKQIWGEKEATANRQSVNGQINL